MIKWLVTWWKWRNRVRVPIHPCNNCLRMMKANGYGLCQECRDLFDDSNWSKEEYLIYMKKHRPDLRHVS